MMKWQIVRRKNIFFFHFYEYNLIFLLEFVQFARQQKYVHSMKMKRTHSEAVKIPCAHWIDIFSLKQTISWERAIINLVYNCSEWQK